MVSGLLPIFSFALLEVLGSDIHFRDLKSVHPYLQDHEEPPSAHFLSSIVRWIDYHGSLKKSVCLFFPYYPPIWITIVNKFTCFTLAFFISSCYSLYKLGRSDFNKLLYLVNSLLNLLYHR